ncbi:MAG: ribonuclease P protein component [Opitutales bacterium]
MTHGFRPAQRLKRPADFTAVRNRSSRAECGSFFLRVRLRREGDGPATARLGIVASRKVGNAVTRNRIKRRFREIFRRHPGLLPEGCDVVVVARPSTAAADYATLEAAFVLGVEKALRRVRRPRERKPDGEERV